jgi:AcrR family transcriptional regulator
VVGSKAKGKREEVPEELSSAILNSARKHFSLHGFQGASLKDIAHEAGVANSLINYHFKDKEGLFKACIEVFAHSRMEAVNRLLAEPKSRDELRVRLELFVDEMFSSILSDPYGFDMIDREMRSGNAMIFQLFQETLLQAFKNVVLFFTQAQSNGLLKADVDPVIVASLLFTSTCDSARKDFLAKKFFTFSLDQPEWRKKFSQHIVNLFLNGVVK